MTRPVVCLMGPTASGKTDLAMALSRDFPLDIVSVDSAMIYRGMDIGSAKPTAEELACAPHRLVDIIEASDSYSAANFVKDAKREIADIHKAGRVPLLVGGTMLYFKALQQGLHPLPEASVELREQITAELDTQGWQAMHRYLQSIDPEAAVRIALNDRQRLIRAIEVYRMTGISLSEHWQFQSREPHDYDFVSLALFPEQRHLLHQRIEGRFERMLEQGLLDECQELIRRFGLNAQYPAMRSVGYRQVMAYLDGEYDKATMIAKAVVATRQLAKRQLTWLRRWESIRYYDPFISGFEQEIAADLARLLVF